MKELVDEIFNTENKYELTALGTQSVMLLRLAKAVERLNDTIKKLEFQRQVKPKTFGIGGGR